MRHAVLISYTLLWSFIKIFYTITGLWFAQVKSEKKKKKKKKNNQREVTQKLWKVEQYFLYDTHRLNP